MSDELSFPDLMARLDAGEEDAAAEVFTRFARRLIGLARSRLDTRVRQKVDPEDVVQSVFRSFFLRQAEGRWDLRSWDGLWALLTLITLRKCSRRAGHFRAARRDVQREVNSAPESENAGAWQALAREPTPEEAVLLTEVVENLLSGLPLPRDRQILELALQGEAASEIARQARCSERTVQRVLGRVRGQLEGPQADENGEAP
jgi:RNA polymerase sigma-70 factor (ECF subfamily)